MLALYLKSLTKMGVKWIRELHLKTPIGNRCLMCCYNLDISTVL